MLSLPGKAITIALLALLLVGCGTTNEWKPPPPVPVEKNQPYSMSKAEITLVETTLRDRMKDPNSTQFRKIGAVVKSDGTIRVCGEVNSKNSFGGYNGFSPFAGDLSNNGFRVVFFGDSEDIQGFTRSSCRISGITL